MTWLTDPNAWMALATLTALEIVLGIDNIIFISILVGRLPAAQRGRARFIGLALAMVMRLGLLWSISWIMRLTEPLLTVFGNALSGRDLILIGGGLFLIWKSVHEVHVSVTTAGEAAHAPAEAAAPGAAVPAGATGSGATGAGVTGVGAAAAPAVARASLASVLAQITVLDIVFSLDSVITAVGLVDDVTIMMAAIVIAVGVMMFAARPIGEFVERHPTLKILALAFLIVVGVVLLLDGFDVHVPKGYVYFAMAFSFAVELLNIRMRRNHGRMDALRRERAQQLQPPAAPRG